MFDHGANQVSTRMSVSLNHMNDQIWRVNQQQWVCNQSKI
jgi:hypothetical protein